MRRERAQGRLVRNAAHRGGAQDRGDLVRRLVGGHRQRGGPRDQRRRGRGVRRDEAEVDGRVARAAFERGQGAVEEPLERRRTGGRVLRERRQDLVLVVVHERAQERGVRTRVRGERDADQRHRVRGEVVVGAGPGLILRAREGLLVKPPYDGGEREERVRQRARRREEPLDRLAIAEREVDPQPAGPRVRVLGPLVRQRVHEREPRRQLLDRARDHLVAFVQRGEQPADDGIVEPRLVPVEEAARVDGEHGPVARGVVAPHLPRARPGDDEEVEVAAALLDQEQRPVVGVHVARDRRRRRRARVVDRPPVTLDREGTIHRRRPMEGRPLPGARAVLLPALGRDRARDAHEPLGRHRDRAERSEPVVGPWAAVGHGAEEPAILGRERHPVLRLDRGDRLLGRGRGDLPAAQPTEHLELPTDGGEACVRHGDTVAPGAIDCRGRREG